ncbi:hypothetical protein F4811DRAFT_523835 [Daldinia bambusicola]|nr:hypothetical protein F4811DRAFT_523835 [Daldinia bambusicola]
MPCRYYSRLKDDALPFTYLHKVAKGNPMIISPKPGVICTLVATFLAAFVAIRGTHVNVRPHVLSATPPGSVPQILCPALSCVFHPQPSLPNLYTAYQPSNTLVPKVSKILLHSILYFLLYSVITFRPYCPALLHFYLTR